MSLLQGDREGASSKKLYNDGTQLAIGSRKMPPIAVSDKVLVQNQKGRSPNILDKSGVIVECKPHNQVNVMMDGSRKVSLRNRQFLRKIETPMPVSGVKPSQFYNAHHNEVDEVQHHRSEDTGHGGRGQLLDNRDGAVSDGGILVDNQVDQQDRVPVDGVDGGVVDTAVDEQPGVSSKRTRKPNSKYDPAIYDLSSVEMRGIPLRGRKNGWKGVYWPQ